MQSQILFIKVPPTHIGTDAGRIYALRVCLIIALIGSILFTGCQKQSSRGGRGRENPFKVTSDDLLSAAAVDAKQAWLIGSFGNILHTSDGGETWQKQDSKGEEQLCEVNFVDAQNGWIVGSNGTIIHTSDGGKNWELQRTPARRLLLNVDFTDTQHGCVVGEQGTLWMTKDGGGTWEDHSIEYGPVLNGVSFIDPATGWVVGDYGTILHTSDGGLTWNEQKCQDIVPVIRPDEWERPLPMLFDIFFMNKDRGWIAGIDGIILYTENGGNLWRKLETNTKGRVYSITVQGTRGWAVGGKGTYLFSLDCGLSWNLSTEAIKTRKWLRDISFFGETSGWIVGATGTVLKTTDGGEQWNMLSGLSYEAMVMKKGASR